MIFLLQIRILEDDGEKGMDGVGQHDDQFLKKIESTLLSQVKLQGIPNIKKVRRQTLSSCTLPVVSAAPDLQHESSLHP